MHRTLVSIALIATVATAQVPPTPSHAELLFVEGTNQFRAPAGEKNPSKGLALLLAAAAKGYELAPFGLCVALSVEPEILNLIESYAWCSVAAKLNNKYATLGGSRAVEVLGRIAVHEGAESVNTAKSKGAEYEATFQRAP